MPTQAEITNPEAFGAPLAKGIAAAERLQDGRIMVRGLPIFSEVRESDAGVRKGVREPRDLAWLEGALRKHRARRELGQAPPMCLRHHFESPLRVGEFELTHIERVQVNPDEDPRFTLMGNKVYLDEKAFDAAKDFDFRSAEISPDRGDELSALALLKDAAPYFPYPNTVERLAPEAAVAAFEAFRATGGTAPQLWKSARETFGATTETKEGVMPADTKTEEKKTPSLEERMEAMAAKCFEGMAKKFEAMFTAATDKKDSEAKESDRQSKDGDSAEDSTKKAGGTEEPSAKKPESAEAKEEKKGPDAQPAVYQATPEQFAAAAERNGIALLSKDEKLELLGLRAAWKQEQIEKQIESFAAMGEQALESAGIPIDKEIKTELRGAAKESGKPGVDRAVAIMTRFAKTQGRAPETYGALAGHGGPAPTSVLEADVKKAVETYGARPDARARIMDLAAQFRAEGETFVRSLAPGEFFATCQGTPAINPSIMEPRGGLRRGI